MATSRRLFLEVLGAGAAASALELGCGGMVEPGHPSSGVGGEGAPSDPAGSGGGGSGGDPPTGGSSGGTSPDDAAVDPPSIPPDAGSAPPSTGGDLQAGSLNTLPVGAMTQVGNQAVAIARDANGVYAVTLTCTHQGCAVSIVTTGPAPLLACPCHGSQFDRNGAVVRGPANRPLVHFAVDLDPAGNFVIHTTRQVPAATRLAV